jgi:hypothetical protein
MPDGGRIRNYLRPLKRHSLLILLALVIATAASLLIAILFGKLLPYEAQAVLLFKAGNSDHLVLTGDPTFQSNNLDPTRQPRDVQTLISSLDIAEKVGETARASSEPDIKTLGMTNVLALRNAIQVEIRGDLIFVTAQAATPQAATWLANTWGTQAITKTSQLYTFSSSGVSEALDSAQQELTASENAVQQFLADSHIDTLRQELAQTSSFIAATTETYTNTQYLLYNTEHKALQENLASAYASADNLNEVSGEIQSLRTRVEQSPDQPDTLYANQISLIVLQNKVTASNMGTQLQLQLNATGTGSASLTKANQLLDLDATLTATQKLQDNLHGQIQSLEEKLGAPLPALAQDSISNVPSALLEQVHQQSQLESEIEAQTFAYNQLKKTRDLRQSTYDLLHTRFTEQQVNQEVGRIVDMASPANELEAADSRSPVKTTLVTVGQGLLLGAVLGIALAYLLYLWRPDFSTNAALGRRFRRGANHAIAARSNE